MASHSNTEQEEPTTRLPKTASKVDAEEETESNVEREEGEMRKWFSTTYERGLRKPMKKPLTAPWDLPISDADVEKLIVGFRSRSMDDKWDLLIEEPDENGNMSIHIIRNWLQEECYILHIVPKPSSDDGESATVQSITWEGNKAGLQCSEEQAKKEAVMLSRGWCHCEFEALPHYPSSMFWDRNGYKRLEAK
ncbi:hypothetical protein INS49_002852 [Diaporthe citri]|uniref:uncharacterized protein n=1 Tax=Diaporthe citri TaxID=83186 RepID=UPI001C7E35E9|nr:uncharacterized protein INS49_002852 [Diaporthe citri]KAG6368639.1 hypothetical protein INS49_002852 [Diaporthe citri]